MVELPLDEVPRDGEIVEVFYRLSRSHESYVDLTVSVGDAVRRLRFTGAREVRFREQPPPTLLGLDVQDVTEQEPRDAPLQVSLADGAITFWAKSITELTRPKFEPRDPPPEPKEEVPVVRDEQVQAWGPGGVAAESFRYTARVPRGVLRNFEIAPIPVHARPSSPFKGYVSKSPPVPETTQYPAIKS